MTSGTGSATNGRDIEGSRQSELARVLDEYLEAVEAGEAVDPEALASAHPEIADRLRACLSVLRVASRVEAVADADAVDPGVATRLGDFRLIRLIGRGGMGVIFEAEQVSLRRRVALKVLPFAAALDPHQLRRFQIEAQAAAQLHQTNIVPIFSVGCERGVHYYAMQYIEGQTLAALVRDLRRPSRWGGGSTIERTAAGASLAEEIASGRLAPTPGAEIGVASLSAQGPFLSPAWLDSQARPGLRRTTSELIPATRPDRRHRDGRTLADRPARGRKSVSLGAEIGVASSFPSARHRRTPTRPLGSAVRTRRGPRARPDRRVQLHRVGPLRSRSARPECRPRPTGPAGAPVPPDDDNPPPASPPIA